MFVKNGAKIFILSPDKILLFHRDNISTIPYPDYWQLIGGGIEEGESPKEALLREVKEECSYKLKKFKLITKTMAFIGGEVWVYVAFIEKNEESKFVLGLGEGQEIKWFTLKEAVGLKLTPGTRILLLKYRDLIEKIMKTN